MIATDADTDGGLHALAAVGEGKAAWAAVARSGLMTRGIRPAVRWTHSLHEDRVWATQDSRAVSRRLEHALLPPSAYITLGRSKRHYRLVSMDAEEGLALGVRRFAG
jgi:hypothetical protein